MQAFTGMLPFLALVSGLFAGLMAGMTSGTWMKSRRIPQKGGDQDG